MLIFCKWNDLIHSIKPGLWLLYVHLLYFVCNDKVMTHYGISFTIRRKLLKCPVVISYMKSSVPKSPSCVTPQQQVLFLLCSRGPQGSAWSFATDQTVWRILWMCGTAHLGVFTAFNSFETRKSICVGSADTVTSNSPVFQSLCVQHTGSVQVELVLYQSCMNTHQYLGQKNIVREQHPTSHIMETQEFTPTWQQLPDKENIYMNHYLLPQVYNNNKY